MICLSFSTVINRAIVEDVLGLLPFPEFYAQLPGAVQSFPQILPHRFSPLKNSVFNDMKESISFSTGSITNTRNMNQRFCVVAAIRRQHSKEVGYAIQR